MTDLLNRNLLNLDPKDPAPFLNLAKETEGCILLTAGDPDFGISDAVKGDVTRSLNLGKTHYADPAGDTRIREPFAWLLWVPAAVILLILLYQYLASVGSGQNLPLLRLLVVPAGSSGSWIVGVESAFAAYLLAFSVRTGRGI